MLHNDKLVEIVGVTADIRSTSLDKDPVLMLYIPYWQRPRLSAALLVRTAMDPRGIASGVRAAIRQVDADVPVGEFKTMQQVMSESVAQRRFQMTLVILFAAAALALAGFGIYGVVSYSVTRRRAEMGIRMALGAGAAGLQQMVLWQAVRPVAAGLAVGVSACPLIPGMTDRDGELEAVAEAAKNAGAQWFFSNVLFLMPSSAKQFLPFVREKFPKLAKQYEEWYAKNGYAPDEYRKQMSQRIAKIRQEYGFVSRPWEERTRKTKQPQLSMAWQPAETPLRAAG